MQSSSSASIDAHLFRPAPSAGPGVAVRDGASVSETLAAAARAPRWRWEAPVDNAGAITLRRMARLRPYNQWLHRRFGHYLGERVLEVGSGVGNQTCYFVDRERVVASDAAPHHVRELTATFGGHSNVRIASFRFPLTAGGRADLRRERIDSIVCANVLEERRAPSFGLSLLVLARRRGA